MVVGRLSRHFDFAICIFQQTLGFSRMATHVELVGLLRCRDFADGLVDETLRGSQIWVLVWIHVLGNSYGAGGKSEHECAAQNYFTNIQGVTSSAKRYQILVKTVCARKFIRSRWGGNMTLAPRHGFTAAAAVYLPTLGLAPTSTRVRSRVMRMRHDNPAPQVRSRTPIHATWSGPSMNAVASAALWVCCIK